MNTKLVLTTAAICMTASSVATAKGSVDVDPAVAAQQVVEVQTGWAKAIPLKGWPVDTNGYIAQRLASQGKAAGDIATVFRPITPCRVVDTRGFGAPIVGGPIAGTNAGTRRAVASQGICGIPNDAVALSLGFAARNNTPNSGGTLSFTATGAPAVGLAAVFNQGSAWTSSNVITDATGGNFDVVVVQANIDIAIDVNGYFEDINELDIGSDQIDINANGGGTAFEINQAGGGDALRVDALDTADGFRIGSGRFGVSNSGVNGTGTAFIHRPDPSAAFGTGTGTLCSVGNSNYSVIDHPMLNNNPTALLFVQPAFVSGSSPNFGPIQAFYFETSAGCTSATVAAKWGIRDTTGTGFTANDNYNILIIDN